MKSVITIGLWPKFYLLFASALLFSNLAKAQLTIQNNTSCPIYVEASQVDNGSGEACTPCNLSDLIYLPAGGTVIHPGDPSCGHYRWLGIRWFTNQIGGAMGISYSPIWNGGCGQSTRGAHCGTTATYARWRVVSSPGPSTVTIHGD
ncbi:MAG: hypothetical protein AAF985_26040 [Bacteroidota bacterium]